MRRCAVVIALVVTVACRREEDAARPSSAEASAPSSFASASASVEPLASAPVASASASASAESAPPEKKPTVEAAQLGLLGLAPPIIGLDGGLSGSGAGFVVQRQQEKTSPTFLPGGHHSTPAVRIGSITVNGRLPKEVVQRIVRRQFGAFRVCYDAGLRQNPALAGRVTTRFVIGGDGTVATAQDAGSDLHDPTVVQCVVRQFARMEFPKPEGGVVVATVPLFFTSSQP